VHHDLLARHAAARPGPLQPLGLEQREIFGRHAGRRIEAPKADHAGGAIPGFFLELADRRICDRFIGILVADQPGRKLDAARADRHPILLHEQHMIVRIHRQDHGRGDIAGAGYIFPSAAPFGGKEPPLPHHFFGQGGILVGSGAHNSISLSGISLGLSSVLGRTRASTAPIRSTAWAMPSPGRPAFTSVTSAAIASPHTSGSTWLWIA